MFKENPKLKNIFLLGFLLALQFAFIAYKNSSFLSSFFGEKNVSLIFILSSAASLLALSLVPGILRKAGEYKFLLWSSALGAIALLLLSVLRSPIGIILAFISFFVLNGLIVFALDELLEIFSKNSSMGRVRGLYLSLVSLAWVIAQAISGAVLAQFSFSGVYFIAFAIMFVFFLVACGSLRNLSDPKYDKVLAWQSLKNFFANKNLTRSYMINFLLQFFYVWMVIYTPIYLSVHLGFDWKEIGIMFSIMLIPFVISPFPLGNYSDKVGERKTLMWGFLIASVFTLLLFFIKEHTVWIWALALFATRVGAATIEAMSDVYFFKHIKRENDEFIAIYRNTAAVSYLAAPFVAFIALGFIPSFNFIFLILGAFMLYGVYLSSTIRRGDI